MNATTNRTLRTAALNAEYIVTVDGVGTTARTGSVATAAVLVEAMGMEGVNPVMEMQSTLESVYSYAVDAGVIAPGDTITLEFKKQDGGYTIAVTTK